MSERWRGMSADRDGKKVIQQEAIVTRGGRVYVSKLTRLRFKEPL